MATGTINPSTMEGEEAGPHPSSLKMSQIRELGSLEWLDEKHRVMFKLVHKALKCERDKDTAASFSNRYGTALPVLVREVVLVRLWKEMILPELLEEINGSDTATTLTRPILTHEMHAIASLRAVVPNSPGPELASHLGEASLDMAHYCLVSLAKALSVTEDQEGTDLADIKSTENTFQHRIFFASLHILRHMIVNLESLGQDLFHLLMAADTPMTLVELLLHKPWTKVAWKGDRMGIQREIETDVWLSLCFLVSNHPLTYDLTEERKTKLRELRPLLDDEDTLDAVEVLRNFRDFLDYHLTMSCTGEEPPSTCPLTEIPLIVPPIRSDLEEQFQNQKDELTELFRKELIGASRDMYEERLNKILSINDRDAVRASFPPDLHLCTTCGHTATKKCKRCRETWYCCRECQVKDWRRHKREDCIKKRKK